MAKAIDYLSMKGTYGTERCIYRSAILNSNQKQLYLLQCPWELCSFLWALRHQPSLRFVSLFRTCKRWLLVRYPSWLRPSSTLRRCSVCCGCVNGKSSWHSNDGQSNHYTLGLKCAYALGGRIRRRRGGNICSSLLPYKDILAHSADFKWWDFIFLRYCYVRSEIFCAFTRKSSQDNLRIEYNLIILRQVLFFKPWYPVAIVRERSGEQSKMQVPKTAHLTSFRRKRSGAEEALWQVEPHVPSLSSQT